MKKLTSTGSCLIDVEKVIAVEPYFHGYHNKKEGAKITLDTGDFAYETSSTLIKVKEIIAEALAMNSGHKGTESADYIDWNELSKRGLIVRINREILHPIGLAIFRDPNTGLSGGALVSPDGVWQYPNDTSPVKAGNE